MLEDFPDQDYKHKGMFHLIFPNDLNLFGNSSPANHDFVCQGREYKRDADNRLIRNKLNHYLAAGTLFLMSSRQLEVTYFLTRAAGLTSVSFKIPLAQKCRPLLGYVGRFQGV
jgi:hypothetical protein